MSPELKFAKTLNDCVKEYKKQYNETRDDVDAAYFYDKKLKKWIKNNMDALTIIFSMNFDRSFVRFVQHYLFDDEKED